MQKLNLSLQEKSKENFDDIVRARLHAADFAQPALKDLDFYKQQTAGQIQAAIDNILEAKTYSAYTEAVAQANAFIDAAMGYEFITYVEKGAWLSKIADAMRVQMIGDSP